jgi:hypothetical protein
MHPPPPRWMASRPVRLAYQTPASSTFLSEQTRHQQPANSTFLSEQISTSHQPPAKRTGCMHALPPPRPSQHLRKRQSSRSKPYTLTKIGFMALRIIRLEDRRKLHESPPFYGDNSADSSPKIR